MITDAGLFLFFVDLSLRGPCAVARTHTAEQGQRAVSINGAVLGHVWRHWVCGVCFDLVCDFGFVVFDRGKRIREREREQGDEVWKRVGVSGLRSGRRV
jgi:hypothetical protein